MTWDIGLTRQHYNGVLPARATPGAFGYDLALVEDTTWQVGETKIAPCGFRLANGLPMEDAPHETTMGLAMLIVPRSSLFLKHGLIIPNSPGLIDADYTGPIGVILWRPENSPVSSAPTFSGKPPFFGEPPLTLPRGTRVAQVLFVPVALPRLSEAEAVERAERGGFGSTG